MHIISRVHIISYNNYCSLLFFGLDKYNFAFLISNQSAAGKNLFLVCGFVHVAFLFLFFHWLPLSQSYQTEVTCCSHQGTLFLIHMVPITCHSTPGVGGIHLPCSASSLHLS